MKLKRLTALMLALILTFSLAACGPKNPETSTPPTESSAPSSAPSSTPSAAPTATPNPTPAPTDPVTSGSDLDPYPDWDDPSIASDSDLEPFPSVDPSIERSVVNLGVLSGPTGIGAVKLLADNIMGLSANAYSYSIVTDNSELVARLSNGELDIATVASNVALNLYNKTQGDVRIIALGTLGVLHILESNGGTSIQSVADLKGKTIYSAGQGANPEYILRYILTQNGLDPDKDVEIIFADASEITQKLLTGDAQVAMLPVPAASAAILRSEGKVRAAIDVTKAWEEVGDGSQLIMTAVVARSEFIEEHPDLVNAFLKEYAASIDYVNNNLDDAAQLVYDFGITPNVAIAKDAIPQCHLVCITGKEMAPSISDYFSILYKLNPASIGGSLPDDGIYYVP